MFSEEVESLIPLFLIMFNLVKQLFLMVGPRTTLGRIGFVYLVVVHDENFVDLITGEKLKKLSVNGITPNYLLYK